MTGALISYVGSILVSGGAVPQAVSAAFPLPVTIGAATVTVVQPTASLLNAQVVGNIASASADSGNPVKIGGVFTSTPPTFTNGQRGDVQIGSRGALFAQLMQPNSISAMGTTTNNTDANAASGSVPILSVGSFQEVYNGVTWDRQAKPRTAFLLPSAAATNNAASIKASPGTIYLICAFGAVAGPAWLKFFDTTGVPNPAALAQFLLFPIVAGLNTFSLPTGGLYFPTGIGVALVTGSADLNNTAVAAASVLGLQVSFL